MNVLLVLSLILSVFVFRFDECYGGIPSDIPKCRAGDVVCIAKITTKILNNNPNGNEELGLRKIEPVHLDELVVARKEGSSPLSLNFKFSNLDVYGLSKSNITKVIGFEKDPYKSKFEMYVTIPELKISGQYEANGRIMLLPIVGKGTADIILKNFKSGVKVKFATKTVNGQQFITMSKIKVQNEPESMSTRLDNLFGGNEALGKELNKVINDNWRDVWTEMESGINGGYSDIVRLLLSDVLKAVSYDDFFVD